MSANSGGRGDGVDPFDPVTTFVARLNRDLTAREPGARRIRMSIRFHASSSIDRFFAGGTMPATRRPFADKAMASPCIVEMVAPV